MLKGGDQEIHLNNSRSLRLLYFQSYPFFKKNSQHKKLYRGGVNKEHEWIENLTGDTFFLPLKKCRRGESRNTFKSFTFTQPIILSVISLFYKKLTTQKIV